MQSSRKELPIKSSDILFFPIAAISTIGFTLTAQPIPFNNPFILLFLLAVKFLLYPKKLQSKHFLMGAKMIKIKKK
jgi:hypothetical protein